MSKEYKEALLKYKTAEKGLNSVLKIFKTEKVGIDVLSSKLYQDASDEYKKSVANLRLKAI